MLLEAFGAIAFHHPVHVSRSHERRPLPNFRALAQCESSDNPRAVDPSGTYYGLYQADRTTWDSVWSRLHRPELVGVSPTSTSRDTQTAFALALYLDRGSAPWPTCGWHLEDAA